MDHGVELVLDDGDGLARFTLVEGFADTKYHTEGLVKGCACLLSDQGRRLMEECAALGVALHITCEASWVMKWDKAHQG